MRDADLVARLGARRAPRAFGKNDELAIVGKLGARPFDHCSKGLRAAAAIDRHHPPFDREPAENGNPLQLALEDEDRFRSKQR